MAAGAGAAKPDDGLVNPHIPEFMAKAPWYLNQGDDKGLSHQRRGEVEDQSITSLEKVYASRGQKYVAATTYRKGACKNCGSATHTERDCVERPRKVGAWKTGSAIGADEALPANLKLGWDAKRDKYAGFDTSEHQRVVARHAAIEKERVRLKEEERKKAEEEAVRKQAEKEQHRKERAARKAAKQAAKAGQRAVDEDAATASDVSDSDATDSDFSASEDEGRGGSGRGRGRQGLGGEGAEGGAEGEGRARSDSKDSSRSGGSGAAGGGAKMISWNVRPREDTAKYLLNLDTESAFYDPKTRSMRENPFAAGDPRAALYGYEGDNAVKSSGQVGDLASDQLFAWEAYNRGADVHLQGNPTQVALLKQQFAQRKEAVRKLMASKLADKYGGSAAGTDADVERPDALPAELRLAGVAESEEYREYQPAIAPDGRIVSVPIRKERSAATGSAGVAASSSSASAAPSNSTEVSGSRSRYPEDEHPGNHTAIYGSWFDREAKVWGFACCHQTLYGSYCTGEAGKRARAEAATFHATAAATHASAMEERSLLALKRKEEADEKERAHTSQEDARARKRARPEDPLHEE